MTNLTERVVKSLDVSEKDANEIIDEQANIGREMLYDGDLNYGDVEDLMYEMGVEPDDMEEFLLRMM